jgi:hypothetical protein
MEPDGHRRLDLSVHPKLNGLTAGAIRFSQSVTVTTPSASSRPAGGSSWNHAPAREGAFGMRAPAAAPFAEADVTLTRPHMSTRDTVRHPRASPSLPVS